MKSRLSAHFFFVSAILLAQLQANDLLTTSEKTTYRVTITTSFQFPKRTPYSQVEVAHPLPVKRSWSETSRNIARQPAGSQIRKIVGRENSEVFWQKTIPSSGGNLSFSTTYETTSVTRSLPPEMAQRARWNSRQVKANKDMNPEIVAMAKTLVKEPSPLEALSKFCAWLITRVVYNANDEPGAATVDELLERGYGQCGDRARVLLQFAQATGLEMRIIAGLHLTRPDGGFNHYLYRIKPVYSNVHAWVEVNIPGLGWIEIEPTHPDIFRITHSFIDTQRQAGYIRLNERGKWVKPTWQATEADPETAPEKVTTTYTSDVGLQTLVTFEILSQEKPTSSKSNSASLKVTLSVPKAVPP
jgi:transglutaminase-like putative cysteine protease